MENGSIMKKWLFLLQQKVQEPTDVASLVMLRIVFGLLMFFEIVRYFHIGWVSDVYAKPEFHFQYEWFWWLRPLPEDVMYLLFGILGVFSILITLGLFYRLATILFFLGYTYVFLLERTTYNNHYYLICLLSFLVALAPLHKSWSLDVLRGSVQHTDRLPVLWLWLFRFQMGLVYFFGGIAKLDPDWLDGRIAGGLMGAANRGTILEPLTKIEWMPHFYSWSGMIFDLLIPFLLLCKPIRLWAFLAAVLFHANNHYVFPIGVFPTLALTLSLLYFDADFPRKIFPEKIRKLISVHYRKFVPYREQPVVSLQNQTPRLLLIFIVIYIFIHMLLPFRHLTTPGWTTWHEEGHFFAWRMMLRQKSTRIQFNVTHPVTGEQRYADPRDYLNHVQYTFFAGSPGMVLQFAHYLDYLVRTNGGFDPKITANVEVSINGREYRQMVDPNLDLSEIPKFKTTYLWMRPFGER